MRNVLVTLLAALATALANLPARADPSSDESAIMQRLKAWTTAFNKKDSAGICDLFASDLIYSVPDVVKGSRADLCGNLDRVLARPALQLHYDNPDVHEIIVSGDLAVVRLTWTLTTQADGAKDTTTEEGIDIFRRQPDGRWSIARFIAFTTAVNKLLK